MRAAGLVLTVLLLPGAASAQSGRRGHDAALIAPGSASVEGRISSARAELDAGRFSEAEALLARLPASVRNRDDVTWLSIRARFGALAVPIEPGGARSLPSPVQNELAALQRRLGHFSETHPGEADALLMLAHLQIAEAALDGAITSLDTYTRLRPNDPVGANDRAMVLVALHRLPEAEEALVTATQLAAHDADPWDNLGAVRLARGEGEAAVQAFNHAIENAPDTARYHSDLGSALLASGHAERAVTSYRRAAELAPTDGVVLSNLGYALALSNHTDEALTTLRHAVDIAPRGVGGWYNLGTVLARRGDTPGAMDAFHHALAIDPNDARTRAAIDALGTSQRP